MGGFAGTREGGHMPLRFLLDSYRRAMRRVRGLFGGWWAPVPHHPPPPVLPPTAGL